MGRAAAALFCLALAAGATQGAGLKSGEFDPPRMAPDFALRGSDGAELRLSRYRGKVVALGFGYTFCPDVCPTTLVDLAQVRKTLGDAGKDLQVIYITVDPERDTTAVLRQYLAAFDPTFVGGTGTPAQLDAVRKAYGITIAKKNYPGSAAYQVHHSSYVYLIDREGKLRAMKPFGVTADDVAHDVKLLLASAASGQTGEAGLRVEEPWARRAPMMEKKDGSNGAVYAMLVNAGKTADALIGAASDAAGAVEVHETYSDMGMMMMRPVKRLALPAGGRVELKPGGYHLMLLNLKRELKAGETLRVTLDFEKAGKLPVEAVIR
jgi:protein SCO1/2